jgi:hypothetical protein
MRASDEVGESPARYPVGFLTRTTHADGERENPRVLEYPRCRPRLVRRQPGRVLYGSGGPDATRQMLRFFLEHPLSVYLSFKSASAFIAGAFDYPRGIEKGKRVSPGVDVTVSLVCRRAPCDLEGDRAIRGAACCASFPRKKGSNSFSIHDGGMGSPALATQVRTIRPAVLHGKHGFKRPVGQRIAENV